MQGLFARAAKPVKAAVDYERDSPFLKAGAEQRTVPVPQPVIQDGSGQSVVFHEDQGMLEGVVVVTAAPAASNSCVMSRAISG